MTTNKHQIEHWDQTAGPKWVRLQQMLDRQLRDFGLAAMATVAASSGERALDIGCGCGASTLELARRLGPQGRVVGLDVSRPMLACAAKHAAAAALENIDFVCADAQTHPLPAESFDLLYSRFGVMFFHDPTAAFANLRRALRCDGRLGFVCWQEAAVNAWMREPTLALMEFVEIDIPRDPHAPGPFAFADRDRLAAILADAGFARVAIEPFEATMTIGGGAGLDEAVAFVLDLSPAGAKLAAADAQTRAAAADAVRRILEPYSAGAGVAMPGFAWLVSAGNA